ncbi:dihydroxy-acid dehydratase [compost metagenome]
MSPQELQARREARPVRAPTAARGYQHLFLKTVTQADKGADFDFLAAVENKGSVPRS